MQLALMLLSPYTILLLPSTGIMADGAGFATGTPLSDPPLLELISEDPVLRHTKLIAEAWDCDGLNQVGGMVAKIMTVLHCQQSGQSSLMFVRGMFFGEPCSQPPLQWCRSAHSRTTLVGGANGTAASATRCASSSRERTECPARSRPRSAAHLTSTWRNR